MDFFGEPKIDWFSNKKDDKDIIKDNGSFEFDLETTYQRPQFPTYEFEEFEYFAPDFIPDLAEILKIEVSMKEEEMKEEVKKETTFPTSKKEEENMLEVKKEAEVLLMPSALLTCKKEEAKMEEVKKEEEVLLMQSALHPSSFRKKRSLQFDEIKNHFVFPQAMAAKNMNVGLTLLKKRCKELNITKWPYRKFKSLMSLIDNFKELRMQDVVAKLVKDKELLEENPEMELHDEIEKLRKICSKRRRSNSRHP